VRVEGIWSRKGPPSSPRDRQAKDLAGEVPKCDVDSAENSHRPPPLRVGVEHVVEVHLDGKRILADQPQVGQTEVCRA